jgi:hypothetical protein
LNLLVLVGTGQALDDACLTVRPPGFAPELTSVRGPIREDLLTFRCEHELEPHTAYVFTDYSPLAGTIVTVVVTVAALCLLWRWALRRRRPV